MNSTKTEIIYFRKKNKTIPNFKIKLNGIKLTRSLDVKYVGVIFDEYLDFSSHIETMNAKLKRANNLIAISRHYISRSLMIQIYYGQFHSHLTYGCQLWGQNKNQIKKTFVLQKKAVRLITFNDHLAHTDPIFRELDILKLADIVTMHNIIFTHNTLNKKSPALFNNYFVLKSINHRHPTTNNPDSTYSNLKGSLEMPKYTSKSGELSIKFICCNNWNLVLRYLSVKYPNKYISNDNWLKSTNLSVLKKLLKEYFLDKYTLIIYIFCF